MLTAPRLLAAELVPPHLVTAPDVPYPEGATGDAVVVLELFIDDKGDVAEVKVEEGDEPFASRAKEGARS